MMCADLQFSAKQAEGHILFQVRLHPSSHFTQVQRRIDLQIGEHTRKIAIVQLSITSHLAKPHPHLHAGPTVAHPPTLTRAHSRVPRNRSVRLPPNKSPPQHDTRGFPSIHFMRRSVDNFYHKRTADRRRRNETRRPHRIASNFTVRCLADPFQTHAWLRFDRKAPKDREMAKSWQEKLDARVPSRTANAELT